MPRRPAAAAFTVTVLALVAWGLMWFVPRIPYVLPVAWTLLTLAVVTGLHTLVVVGIARRVDHPGTRYAVAKGSSIVNLVLFVIALVAIWAPDPTVLLLTGGFAVLGAAFSLQDTLRNFVGGLVIVAARTYRVGDRIRVGGLSGDVIDIDLLYTTVQELRTHGLEGAATGGIVQVPNARVLTENVNNYTRDHEYMWDELELPIKYESSWRETLPRLLEVVAEENQEVRERARTELPRLMSRYYLGKVDVEPTLNVRVTDNYLVVRLRFLTEVSRRGGLRNRIMERLLEEFEDREDLHLGATSFAVSDVPPLELRWADGTS